jgi:integrase/recombinase XerD
LSFELIPSAFSKNPAFQISAFDGSTGVNRASGPRQIAANRDVDAISAWLMQFQTSKSTFDSYRKEAERLLLWSVLQLSKPLSSLVYEDLQLYRQFLLDPQPADFWVSSPGRRFGRNDSRWRPFAGPLSASSQRQTLVILNSMFSWMVESGYLLGNPLALGKRRSSSSPKTVTRYLDPNLWLEVKAFILELRSTDLPRYHRLRWLFSLFYLGGLRISEVSQGCMGDFYFRRAPDGKELWWLRVIGKGNKERQIPISVEFLDELLLYRSYVQVSGLPSVGEQVPLFGSARNFRVRVGRSSIHGTETDLFAHVAAKLRMQGDMHALRRASQLESASAHWLRHTAGSHMANSGVDLRVIRDNLGHASISTTSIYLHTDDDQRHADTSTAHRVGWSN